MYPGDDQCGERQELKACKPSDRADRNAIAWHRQQQPAGARAMQAGAGPRAGGAVCVAGHRLGIGGCTMGWHGRQGQCQVRAHPDLNQGPADLQSAALSTELCTQLR